MILTSKEILDQLKPNSAKKIDLQCDSCKNKYQISYQNYNSTQKRRNYDGLTICRSCTSKNNAKENFKDTWGWNKGQRFPLKSGPNSPTWKGGSYISSDGYKMIRTKTGRLEKECGWNQYSKEHRIIAEKQLGRTLFKEEIVHHINGDKLDNKQDNLSVLKNNKEHKALHAQLQNIAFDLVKSGIIKYDRSKREYFIEKSCI